MIKINSQFPFPTSRPTSNIPPSLPKHVAFICDGNRRWAKAKGLPEFSGHKHAVEITIEQLIDHGIELCIPFMSFWVLSTENWKRGKFWMTQYFKLMHFFFKKRLHKLLAKGVKIKAIGNLSQLPQNIQKILKELEEKSSLNNKITLIIAINYGGREEILRAINKILKDPVLCKDRVFTTEKEFSSLLDTANIPNPDLIIRTAGEQRLSGFMLWQCQYSELYFTNTLFPDFTPKELDKALADYSQRKRNFGK